MNELCTTIETAIGKLRKIQGRIADYPSDQSAEFTRDLEAMVRGIAGSADAAFVRCDEIQLRLVRKDAEDASVS